jgi:hypothetical protein
VYGTWLSDRTAIMKTLRLDVRVEKQGTQLDINAGTVRDCMKITQKDKTGTKALMSNIRRNGLTNLSTARDPKTGRFVTRAPPKPPVGTVASTDELAGLIDIDAVKKEMKSHKLRSPIMTGERPFSKYCVVIYKPSNFERKYSRKMSGATDLTRALFAPKT